MTNLKSQDLNFEEDDQIHSFFITNSQLFKTRLVIATLVFSNIVWMITVVKASYFLFLTNWTWILNCIYFLLALALSNRQRPPTDYYVFKYFYSCLASIPWIVSIVFFSLLKSEISHTVSVDQRLMKVLSHTMIIFFPIIDLFRKSHIDL